MVGYGKDVRNVEAKGSQSVQGGQPYPSVGIIALAVPMEQQQQARRPCHFNADRLIFRR
jgi:hypothetical protein